MNAKRALGTLAEGGETIAERMSPGNSVTLSLSLLAAACRAPEGNRKHAKKS